VPIYIDPALPHPAVRGRRPDSDIREFLIHHAHGNVAERVDLNSKVFDSPRLTSSSALRWPRTYWSKRKFFRASPKAASSVIRLYRSKLVSTISWITSSTLWSKVSRTFSRVLTRAAASSAASSSSFYGSNAALISSASLAKSSTIVPSSPDACG
jgi:hypothetical protein